MSTEPMSNQCPCGRSDRNHTHLYDVPSNKPCEFAHDGHEQGGGAWCVIHRMFCKAAPDPDLIAALRASLPTQPNDVTEADRKLVRAAVYGGREDRPSIERIQISLEEITVRVLALLSSQREEQVRELIDRIIGTLKSYPDGGGDVGIMAEVDRLLREQREADCRAVRALIEHDPTTCAYDPCGQCEHVGGLFDAEAAIRSLSLPEPPATPDRSNWTHGGCCAGRVCVLADYPENCSCSCHAEPPKGERG